MSEITGGQAVHDALVKLGVRHIFGIPSVHNLPIFDAIMQGGMITPIITRHEQAAVHAADGYARASGQLGVVVASTGPGTTNTVTGLYESSFASSRVLLITGQTESTDYGKGRFAGHEAENQFPMLATVVRRVESPRYTQDIAAAIFSVVADIGTGRPQPGAIEIPIDIQYGATSVAVGDPIQTAPVQARSDLVNQAVELIGNSQRRVILAGGGVISGDATAELEQLAETLKAPVFVSQNGRGALADDHELAMGPFINRRPMQPALENADVVIAVGTRLRGQPGTWRRLPGKLIHIDIDPRVHGLVLPAEVSIIADAKSTLKTILSAMNAVPGDPDFLEGLKGARAEIHKSTREIIGVDMEAIMDCLRETMARDDLFVRDMTLPNYAWGNQLFPIYEPRTTMNPNSGAIGPGLPMANGAAVATGRKTVVFHGDGGIMLHIGELATAAQYNLPVIVCVFTDGGYGILRGLQSNRFEGRNVGVDLLTPNFVTMARGMGVPGEQVKGVDGFKAAILRGMEAGGPYLLDIDMRELAPMRGFGKRVEFEQPGD